MSPRTDRGPNARRPLAVLLTAEEKAELEAALELENDERKRRSEEPIGLGTKLRQLGLVWARSRAVQSKKSRGR